MTATRGSYEVSLISNKDTRWVPDSSQHHCYVCTTAKLVRGKRHHCRMCGNIACHDCCPRVCKRCLAENISSISARKSISRHSRSEIHAFSVNYETLSQIQRLCKLKSKQIRWKKVKPNDNKTYFEPVYIISEVSTNVCIIRTVDGAYYATNKDTLHVAPQKENLLDSLQCLIHGYINRSKECCISLTKPIYALQENESISRALSENFEMNKNVNKDNKILKQCNILSFFPMLQKDSYKLNGFIFKSSLTKMNIDNVQLFHFVSDHESPKKIPAYYAKRNSFSHEHKTADAMIAYTPKSLSRSRLHSPSLPAIKNKSVDVMELELESFKTGYQEMRKMYEDYVRVNEEKMKQYEGAEKTIARLHAEIEHLTQSKDKYRQAVDINAKQVRELQEQLQQLSMQYQQKLDNQSMKYKDATEKTTQDAQSQLLESYNELEQANEEIARLKEEVNALMATKPVNHADEIQQIRLEKEQQRCKDLEIQLKDMTFQLEAINNKMMTDTSQSGATEPILFGMQHIRNEIGHEYNELFTVHHKQLFEMLLKLMTTYRSMWDKEYVHQLIYELLFNILTRCYEEVSKYEENVSVTLCKQFCINKDILYESFYSEWIHNSKCETFLDSADVIKELRNYVMDTMFVQDFLLKYLDLNTHQISAEIHQTLAEFIGKCVCISWKMCTQHPVLGFTPKVFHVKQLNKEKYHQDLHNTYGKTKEDKEYILYHIWPIISYNNFHSIVDYMKIEVCLGDKLADKKNTNNKEDVNDDDDDMNGDNQITDDTYNNDSGAMLIVDHDDDMNDYEW